MDIFTLNAAKAYAEQLALGGAGLQETVETKVNEYLTENDKFTNHIINIKEYGASGDGITDDTEAIKKALSVDITDKIIIFPSGTYLITDNIDTENEHTELSIIGEDAIITATGYTNDVSYTISLKSKALNIKGIRFEYIKALLFYSSDSVVIDTCTFYRSTYYAILQKSQSNLYHVKNSRFIETGYGRINADSGNSWEEDSACRQDIRVSTTNAKRLIIENCYFNGTEGHAPIFILQDNANEKICYATIRENEFTNTRYKAIEFIPINDGNEKSIYGEICNNYIHECGTLTEPNTENGGVGRNGIYAFKGASLVSVTNNVIKNLYENGIEGTFKCINYNHIENMGINNDEYPTPSRECIYSAGTPEIIGNVLINPDTCGIFSVLKQSNIDSILETSKRIMISNNTLIYDKDNNGVSAIKYYGNDCSSEDLEVHVINNTIIGFSMIYETSGTYTPYYVSKLNKFELKSSYGNARMRSMGDNAILLYDKFNINNCKPLNYQANCERFTESIEDDGSIKYTVNVTGATYPSELKFKFCIPQELFNYKNYQFCIDYDFESTDESGIKIYYWDLSSSNVKYITTAKSQKQVRFLPMLTDSDGNNAKEIAIQFAASTKEEGVELLFRKLKIYVVPLDSDYKLYDTRILSEKVPTYMIANKGDIVYNDLTVSNDYAGWIFNGSEWIGFGAIS